MSAFSRRLLFSADLSLSDVLLHYEGWGVVGIPGDLLQSLDQRIEISEGDDADHPCNSAHVEIIGYKGKKLEGALKKLDWAIRPSGIGEGD
jgi:hypothetical protein